MGSRNYGALVVDDEQHLLDIPGGSSSTPRRNGESWKKAALGLALGLAAFGVSFSVHHSLAAQNELLLSLQKQLSEMQAAVAIPPSSQSVDFSHIKAHSTQLPHKFAVALPTPLKTQDNRGTCWDFATIGVLEHSYRQQGIANGWLTHDEYMALSEQAYGAEILRLCTGPPGSPQQQACLVPGNGIWKNSTEGGASSLLFYLQHGFESNIYPHSICPYDPEDGNDTVCEGLDAAARASNPLKVEVKSFETLYDITSVKNALVATGSAMAITTSMPYITYYYPCIGDLAKDERCNPASISCTLCPPELAATTCCIPVTDKENYNMKGEYITSHTMTLEGGHVMTLAGFNDEYRTQQGFTGGFILKNSWFDGVHPKLGPTHARGSHSLRYWLQEITDWEEAVMCPNSHNPENWYQCGNSGEVIHSHAVGVSGADVPFPVQRSSSPSGGVEECLTEETALYAKTNFQPLHLRCTDSTWCNESDDITYFVRNSTAWGDRMLRFCLFEYNTVTSESSEVCLPPMLGQELAYVLTPVDDEALENDPDVCGYYFYPYEIFQQYSSKFGDVSVDVFDLEWHPQSYAANAEDYPDLDYQYVQTSTLKQRQYEFVGPFPFARVVSKHELPEV